jgi:hypothetical protein
MIEISNTAAPMLIQALRDAVRFNEQLLNSETLRNRADYEEHLVQLSQFFAEMKSQYKRIEKEAGISLEELL